MKRSAVSGKAPAAADLQVGELAVNTADGRLFSKKSDGSIYIINPVYGIVPQSVTVDMGTIGLPAYTFTQTVAGARVGMAVMATMSVASGYSSDELEMEPMTVGGIVIATDQIQFTITVMPPLLTHGSKVINFYLG